MSLLIRLYPRAWRDRYEAELLDLLDQRPGSLKTSFDLVRGAADAHLHPQGGPPIPWTWRLPGVVVAATGLFWLAAFASALASAEPWTGTLLGLGMLTMFIGLPGDYMAAHRPRIVLVLGAFVLAIVATSVAGNADAWELATAIGLGAISILLGGSLTLVGIRAGLAARARRIVLVGFVVLPMIGALSTSAGGSIAGAVLIACYPLSWCALGVRLILRGSQTLVDAPEPSTLGQLAQEISA